MTAADDPEPTAGTTEGDINSNVGYRRPPSHTRFKPGASGNPRGRPKGAKSVETLSRDLLNRKVTITEGGARRRVSLLEAILLSHSQRAIKGDAKAARLLIELGRRVSEVQQEDATPTAEQDQAIIDHFLSRQDAAGDERDSQDPSPA